MDRLDDALVHVRRALQRPGYRRHLIELSELDAPLATLRVVRAVQRSPEQPPGISDLAELLLVDPSTASRAVDDAVSRGYLQRQSCDRDRRRARVLLTPMGRAALKRMTEARRAVLGQVTSTWRDTEVDEFVSYLERLLVGFERLEDDA
jgi:DNA-binding MarR family transcriptional regulator